MSTTIQVTPRQLREVLETAIPNKRKVLIVGAPGIGKTDIVTQACHAVGADLISAHPVVEDPTVPGGMPYASEDTEGNRIAEFLPFGLTRKLMAATGLTAAFLDDLGQAAPATQAAYMNLILKNQIGDHVLDADKIVWIAATNRKGDRAGVSGILEPLKSRFHILVELIPDPEDWTAYAIRAKLPVQLIAFMRFRPELLHQFEPTAAMINQPCPRTVTHFGQLLGDEYPDSVRYQALSGAVGEGFTAEYLAFEGVYRECPGPAEILLDPKGAPVPDLNAENGMAVTYAITGSLASMASPDAIESIVTYGARLPAEFSAKLMRDCYQHDPRIKNSHAWIQWASTTGADLFLN